MASHQQMKGGTFYGAVQHRQTVPQAIFTDLVHTSPRKLPAHSHQLPFVALLLRGSYGEKIWHQNKQFGPFTAMFRPCGVPHQDEIGPRGVHFFEIEILPAWIDRLQASPLTRACDDCHGGELFCLAMRLFRATRGPVNGEELTIESLLAELIAAAASEPHERLRESPAWLLRVVERLHDEFCERLLLDDLSLEAGVHPVHLSRVFRRCLGLGIGEYLHRLRIRAACEQMIDTERPLCEIGLNMGFADQSHFTRAFQRITGMSPGRFRDFLADDGHPILPVLKTA